MKELAESVDKIFGPASAKKGLKNTEFDGATTDIFKIPKIFRDMLYAKVESVGKVGATKQGGDTHITRETVLKYWDLKDFHRKDPKRRIFDVIK